MESEIAPNPIRTSSIKNEFSFEQNISILCQIEILDYEISCSTDFKAVSSLLTLVPPPWAMSALPPPLPSI